MTKIKNKNINKKYNNSPLVVKEENNIRINKSDSTILFQLSNVVDSAPKKKTIKVYKKELKNELQI